MARPGAVIRSTNALLVSIQALAPESTVGAGLGPSAAEATASVESAKPSAHNETETLLMQLITDTRKRGTMDWVELPPYRKPLPSLPCPTLSALALPWL
jgi:hypothetical protein